MKIVGYVRVSTDEQVRDGDSLDAQKGRIEAWAKAMDYSILHIEADEGISGKSVTSRQGLQRAVEIACSEGAALVVYSLSRLSRSTRDTLMLADTLDKSGADLVSLSERIDTTSASGKMVFRMLAVLNEFERDQISERTSAILQHKKSKLEAYSPTPYGYKKKGKRLFPCQTEQEVISEIFRLRKSGFSLRRIARSLNKKGIPAKKGGLWHPSAVYYILTNSLHVSLLT